MRRVPELELDRPSHEEALKGVRSVVAGVVADLRAKGEKVPEPFAARRFTGKLEVRVSEDIHRRLAIEATEEGVSLDGLVAAKLGT